MEAARSFDNLYYRLYTYIVMGNNFVIFHVLFQQGVKPENCSFSAVE